MRLNIYSNYAIDPAPAATAPAPAATAPPPPEPTAAPAAAVVAAEAAPADAEAVGTIQVAASDFLQRYKATMARLPSQPSIEDKVKFIQEKMIERKPDDKEWIMHISAEKVAKAIPGPLSVEEKIDVLHEKLAESVKPT